MFGSKHRNFMHMMYGDVKCLVTQYNNVNYINVSKFGRYRAAVSSWFGSVYGKREIYKFKHEYNIEQSQDGNIEEGVSYRHSYLNNEYRGRYVHELLAVRILSKINLDKSIQIERAIINGTVWCVGIIELLDHPERLVISPTQSEEETYTLTKEFCDMADYIEQNSIKQNGHVSRPEG